MPEVTLDTRDPTELSDVLHFLPSWLARDPGRLRSSLEGVAGHDRGDGSRPLARQGSS